MLIRLPAVLALLLTCALAAIPSPAAGEQQPSAAPAAGTPAQDVQELQLLYKERSLRFDKVPVINGRGVVTSYTGRVYRGRSWRPLEGEYLYTQLGRPELARAYRLRSLGRIGLMVAGAATLASGVWVGMPGLSRCVRVEATYNYCLQLDQRPLYAGALLAVAGGGMLVGGLRMEPRPTDLEETQRLVEEYNQRLKQEMGLAPGDAAASSRPAPPLRLSLGGVLTPTGGALVLGGEF